ncbi:MAG: DUF3883 domain-containing protein [Blastocatellia bacterium]
MNGEYNLQRKIVKGEAYKNWRLNGEYVLNPDDNVERFNALVPTDLAVFSFDGDICPTAASVVFVAQSIHEDAPLHAQLDSFLEARRMAALWDSELARIVASAGIPEAHPINALLLDAALEDASLGGTRGVRRLSSQPSGRKLSREDLQRARQKAEEIGSLGEDYVNSFMLRLKDEGRIEGFQWVSLENAVAPYDFLLMRLGGQRRLVDVKATSGEFERPIHISLNELRQMSAGADQYDLYRIYDIGDGAAKLRIAENVKDFAASVVAVFDALPTDVTVDGISVPPSFLNFQAETKVELIGDRDDVE